MTGTLVLLSGGLDSTVLATVTSETERTETLSIHYGQRHARELEAASAVAAYLGVLHDTVDLSVLRQHLTGSALTDDVDVPEGHYAEASMRVTVVPNRNAIMLSVAVGIAVSRGLGRVVTAVHAGDHFVYPDCRPAFVRAMNTAARTGTEGFGDVAIEAPFLHRTKADIVLAGAGIRAPMSLSWSCYQGGAAHCGRCGTCVERNEAFRLAKVADPTVYADADYALTVAP
jgi:7-cyano-7-deazaguanine synthase